MQYYIILLSPTFCSGQQYLLSIVSAMTERLHAYDEVNRNLEYSSICVLVSVRVWPKQGTRLVKNSGYIAYIYIYIYMYH